MNHTNNSTNTNAVAKKNRSSLSEVTVNRTDVGEFKDGVFQMGPGPAKPRKFKKCNNVNHNENHHERRNGKNPRNANNRQPLKQATAPVYSKPAKSQNVSVTTPNRQQQAPSLNPKSFPPAEQSIALPANSSKYAIGSYSAAPHPSTIPMPMFTLSNENQPRLEEASFNLRRLLNIVPEQRHAEVTC